MLFRSPMDSRRLVVWMSACILGFQGGTLLLDLGHCTVLSWLYLQSHGLPTATDPTLAFCERPRSRVDAAVGQGLSVLAGLALGGSVGDGPLGPGSGGGRGGL